ncbi:zinc finger, GRF-type containing protein [Tanacetum coccineum]
MVRCACGLEAVIRTSWTNRNPGRRFYGCPTLSPTCVNFLRWYDPPMCQRSVQIIPGLLRSRNELEEILAMVEEKRRKLLTFLIISWVTQREAQQANELSNLTRQRQLLVSVNFRLLANSDLLKDQLLVYLDLKTQREVHVATKINNLTRQLLDIIDERRSFIGELEQRLLTNVMAYKTRQELKGLQKDDMIRVMEMRLTALQFHHQAMKGFHFYKSL